jgi:hypothetical protein
MIIHDRSFPYPVLAAFRDDVQPNKFGFEILVTSDADNFYIEAKFDYSNPTLQTMVGAGTAIHAVQIECKRNYFRALHVSSDVTQKIVVRASDLVGRVEANGFVVACNKIGDYTITGSHSDYGETEFSVQVGDVLALSTTQRFDAYVDYDPLKQISSILMIRRSETLEEGEMQLDTSEDRLIATLSQRDYERYTDLKGDPSLRPLLANEIVVPSLIEAVHEIRRVEDAELDIEMSKRWFRSIVKKLEDDKIDARKSEKPVLQIVQHLLKLPLRRTLEGLIQMNPTDDKP